MKSLRSRCSRIEKHHNPSQDKIFSLLYLHYLPLLHLLIGKVILNNSQDTYTLQNRANKVKERVLGCGTNNELISLHADGKVSEPEVKWIKANYLSESELAQLVTIEGTLAG